jgi:hypothetical protein
VVVPELGGTTTVVARFGGGLLLTQPQSMAPSIIKLDAIFMCLSFQLLKASLSVPVDDVR